MRLLLPYRSEDAQAAYEHEALYRHGEIEDGIHQMPRSLAVRLEEVSFVQTFRHAGGMHHIVEAVLAQLLLELMLVVEIQFYEVYPLLRQIFP